MSNAGLRLLSRSDDLEASNPERCTKGDEIVPCRSILNRVNGKFEHLWFSINYVEIAFDDGKLKYASEYRQEQKRIDSLFTKEPTTILWMDQFKPHDVMFDVGANVGMYSIYAGKIRHARVFSFEPESQNYSQLSKNIFLNELNGSVTAYNLAITDKFDISTLFLSHFCPGFAHHDFGENRWVRDMDLGHHILKRNDRIEQGCTSVRMDDIVQRGFFPTPQHIKVDVDGFEWKVVQGAQDTLRSSELRTVLIETDNSIKESVEIIKVMTDQGWSMSYDQMRVNQHEVMSEQNVKDRIARGIGGQNIIYFKDEIWFDIFRHYASNFVAPNPHTKPEAEVL